MSESDNKHDFDPGKVLRKIMESFSNLRKAVIAEKVVGNIPDEAIEAKKDYDALVREAQLLEATLLNAVRKLNKAQDRMTDIIYSQQPQLEDVKHISYDWDRKQVIQKILEGEEVKFIDTSSQKVPKDTPKHWGKFLTKKKN